MVRESSKEVIGTGITQATTDLRFSVGRGKKMDSDGVKELLGLKMRNGYGRWRSSTESKRGGDCG